jgi:predicted nuclease of predicted toxin-antitoxin system
VKCLADMGIAISTVQTLRQHSHDLRHLSEEGLERLPDPLILDKAGREGRIVITCDLDFADLLALGAHTLPSVILLRLQNQTPGSVTPRLLQVLTECRDALTTGAIVTIEETRYRLRRLPIEPSTR